MFISRLLLSHAPLTGWYRYKDVFQLIPAPPEAPRPPVILGDYPLILELQYDQEIVPERTVDFWHRDVWERVREKELNLVPGTPEQTSMHRTLTKQNRSSAIVKELNVLLSALTNHRFFEYDSQNSWTIHLDPETTSERPAPVWSQRSYVLPFEIAPIEEFTTPDAARSHLAQMGNYYHEVPDAYTSGQEFNVQLPEAIDALLDIYFALEDGRKSAFYAACHLWGQFLELRHTAPSMSLVAAVAAIETLANSDNPASDRCPECGIHSSIERCPKCGAARYRLTSRFKKFIHDHAGSGLGNFADQLYVFRGNISHAGELLREELFESGFTTGGKDEQMIFRYDCVRITHLAIVKWLIAQA